MLEIAKTLTQSKVSQNYILGVKKKTNSVKGCSQQKQQTRGFNCCCFFFLFYLYSKVKMSRHGSYKVTVLLAFSCFHCFKPSTSHWWFGLSVFSVHGSKPFISSSCLCDTHVMWRPREEGGWQEPPKKGGGSGESVGYDCVGWQHPPLLAFTSERSPWWNMTEQPFTAVLGLTPWNHCFVAAADKENFKWPHSELCLPSVLQFI